MRWLLLLLVVGCVMRPAALASEQPTHVTIHQSDEPFCTDSRWRFDMCPDALTRC